MDIVLRNYTNQGQFKKHDKKVLLTFMCFVHIHAFGDVLEYQFRKEKNRLLDGPYTHA